MTSKAAGWHRMETGRKPEMGEKWSEKKRPMARNRDRMAPKKAKKTERKINFVAKNPDNPCPLN